MFGELGDFRLHPLVLRKRIEGDMTTAMQYFLELVCLVRRAICVSKRAKFFERKACLAETACGSMLDEFAENRKSTP